MRARVLVSTALVAAAVSLGVSYGAHAYRSGTLADGGDPFAQLDLSGAQRQQIRDVLRRFHPRLVAMQAGVDRKRSELAALLAGPASAEAEAVRACLAEISRLEAERDQEVVRNLLELKPHLTAEQQQTLFRHIELRHTSVATAH
jgi:Spy/CpxP family protein refolding chaperone